MSIASSSNRKFENIHCSKMKFPIKVFFSKCHQICSFLRIWSHLLKKSLMEHFIFCAVIFPYKDRIKDSVHTREIECHRKIASWHSLCRENWFYVIERISSIFLLFRKLRKDKHYVYDIPVDSSTLTISYY